ncbi:MAG TPA: hypothetical protein VGD99_26675 [Anaerolineae bacterium]|jgi:hypothetical protein
MVLETLSAAAGVWLWDTYGKEFVDKLLLDCLNVAYVTNRAEIEAGLLAAAAGREGGLRRGEAG